MKLKVENMTEVIKKSRPNLKENSIKQYEAHLRKLRNIYGKEDGDYGFLSDVDDVIDKLKEKHYTSQRNTLNAIIILLLALNHDKKYDELIEEYQKRRDKLNDKYVEDQESGKISDKQKENFVDISEVNKMINQMGQEIKDKKLKKKKNLKEKKKNLIRV